ncbi:MAG TPA: Fe-S oxidoreductase, partial [Acidimicrobiales bacterium]|nr:Fe-S oxidoreductase [Acidimicrobiales bacterium]
MLVRIIIGLAVTVVGFAVAGRRFYWLSTLIRSGQDAPRRWQGVRKVSEVEVVEVAGQRKLLRWTVPGIAHFFTMWGFTVLLTTILEAYGALFQRSFHIPWIGQSNWLAFVEDFFATAVLVSLVVFSIIRLRNAPARKDRSSRFYGSHNGAAWAVLGMIALVIITLLMYRAAQIDT